MFLSIDPGLNNCGLAIFDIENNKFIVKDTFLVKNARKFTDEEKLIEQFYNNRTVKVIAIIEFIKNIIEKNNIECIVIEAPFYNALTPMAYGSLLEVIFGMKYSIIVPNNLKIKFIEPLLVKKLFSNQRLASKDLIKEFLINKKQDGSIILDKDPLTLSEHEIDAIAVGFVHYLEIIQGDQNDTSST